MQFTPRPLASFELQRNQLDFLLAQEARLQAELDNADQIKFPEELENRRDEHLVAEAITDQTKQFQERRASLKGQIDLLESKITQYKDEISGLKQEREATTSQLANYNLALGLMGADPNNAVANIQSIVASGGQSGGSGDLSSLLGALGGI